MNADEQRARELLAAAYRDADQHEDAYAVANGVNAEGAYGPELAAIMAALAQQVPEGGEWVLVPRELTRPVANALGYDSAFTTWSEMQQTWADAIAATPQAPQPVVDGGFDPADDTPTKLGKYSEPGAEHVNKRGEAECPTCGTPCRTEYVLWSSQFLGTQSRTDFIPIAQPQQPKPEADGDVARALEALLPYVQHEDSCGDMDAYNNAQVQRCGCGLESTLERAHEALAAYSANTGGVQQGVVACWRIERGDFRTTWSDGDISSEDAGKLAGSGFSVVRAHTTTGQQAVTDAAMFAWLAKYPNLYTVTDLLRADQYATLRRACEALMPFDDYALAADAGEVGNG